VVVAVSPLNDASPPTPGRRRSDARRNRDAIVAAAVVELRRTGDLNMQAVAAAAGVNRSTLYRHFPARSSLEDALRADALAAARQATERVMSDEAPALALFRRLVVSLVQVGNERRLDLLDALPLRQQAEEIAGAMLPALDRLRRAAEIAPVPPPEWLRRASAHLLQACLAVGSRESSDVPAAAESLFRSLTNPLDQGLVVLDPQGTLLCLNPRAAAALDPSGRVEVGERLTEPRVELLYEDGSPSPGAAYPLAAAVRTMERQQGVRGHRAAGGTVAWMAIEAVPLESPEDGVAYGIVGILSDVTAERDWELEQLHPPGQLAAARGVPLDIARILDEIPPHLFPEQLVSEARRVGGGPVALYVLDIDGTHLLRLAGPEEFPARIEAPLALGPELAQDGIPDLRARLRDELPGVTMAPMWLRGRAVGLLLGVQAPDDQLLQFGRHAAAAMELAGGYTDVIDAARRRKETRAAAELQQSLVPPRIARMGGGELAGSVLPTYEVGGDWFDYVENRDGAWIAIADAVGKGPTAGALGGVALAALRAARRSDRSLEEAAQSMHEVVFDVGKPEFFVTALIARWNAVHSVLSWINCGHPPPLVLRTNGTREQPMTKPELPRGLFERQRRFVRRQRRLEDGERLILHSDGITARRTADGLFGLDGIERAITGADSRSATAIARAIQEAVMTASEDPLQDDAVAVVLAPTAGSGRALGRPGE
jgi:serine phosphatase RsbU (regulator of sigma subunit)/AcrR family transcriptional regulator